MANARLGALALFVSLTACNTPMKQTPATVTVPPSAAAVPALPQPPVAAKKPHAVTSPNGSREDEYYWLRDDKRENPEMLAYVKAENAYADRDAGAHQGARNPDLQRDHRPAEAGRRHGAVSHEWLLVLPALRNRQGISDLRAAQRSKDAPEEILFNVNEMAKGHDFFEVGEIAISPDNALVAWAEDTVGRRQYTIHVMEIASRRVYPLALPNVENNVVWAGDNRTFLYVEKDPDTLLGRKVRRHSIDSPNHTDVSADPLVWEQTDESFYTGVGKTKDEKFLWIATQSTVSSETWFADANDPQLRFKVFLPRERDHEYQAEHANGRWIVRTNWQAKNFRIVEVKPGDEGDRSKWKDVIAHRDDAFVDGYDVSKNFLTVEEHSGGLRKLRIHAWKGGKEVLVTADEPSYTMAIDVNREFDSDKLRYTYTSLVTPRTTYDYDFKTGERELLKREPVLGGYDPANYATEFAWATARDGTRVPVSIVYRRNTPRDGTAPLLQIGYGSYGYSYDPEFSYLPASLLDRGFVVAIAHIRGGQEMGRKWYEDGKLLHKMNTFTDFIDVTRWLGANRYNNRKKAFAIGRSAGGLLMGAIANMAPRTTRASFPGCRSSTW